MAFSVVWAAVAILPGGSRRSDKSNTEFVYRRAAGDFVLGKNAGNALKWAFPIVYIAGNASTVNDLESDGTRGREPSLPIRRSNRCRWRAPAPP